MTYQGLYGAFPFTVSDVEVCTFRGLKTSREQVYATHNVMNGAPKLQHTGRNLSPVSLNMQIVPPEGFSTVHLRLPALEAMTARGRICRWSSASDTVAGASCSSTKFRIISCTAASFRRRKRF